MHPLPGLVLSAVATSVLVAAAAGQHPLAWRNGNLVAVGSPTATVREAIAATVRGPDAAQRTAGFRSALAPGTRLVDCRVHLPAVTVVLDEAFLQGPIEDGIEQLTKTAMTFAEVRTVHLRILRADGTEADLTEALGAAAIPAPAGHRFECDGPLVQGALTGKTVVVSPGHGWYFHPTLGWTTQRGTIDGLTEDFHTNEIAMHHLVPALENLGATVITCRERGQAVADPVVDNDAGAPGYAETGGWSVSASSGYQNLTYRFAGTAPSASATATWTFPVPTPGLHPVYAWFRAGTNRAPDARYTVHHAGGATVVNVDQRRDNLTWVHLGDFWFTPATPARLVLDNQSTTTGAVVIADAARLGGGTGSIVRGTAASQRPRWQEASRYWAQFSGAPATVYDSLTTGNDADDDVSCRPRFAEWRTADAFLSLHTNAGGGAGTETFIHDTAPTTGSANLQQRVQSQLIADIRAEYLSTWVDRGLKTANFGELRLLSTMPGCLVELAFHDTVGSADMRALHDPRFRYIAGRAMARGVMRHFNASAPNPPEPPLALRVVQDGSRGLLVAWDAVAGATHYTIEQSEDGKGFIQVAQVAATSWSTGPLPMLTVRSFRVRAWNASGRSFPTEVLTAGTDHTRTAQLLLVYGFDRFDRQVQHLDNTRDHLRLLGEALRRDAYVSTGFDAASNEAVRSGRVQLTGYRAVAWSLGEESTVHETFDATEQQLVQAYLAAGGRMLVSGAELAWDLDALGTAADRAFLQTVLGVRYVSDDAATHQLQAGIAGTVSADVPAGAFDDGTSGTYDVDYPDVLAAADALGQVCLRYGNGLVAGIQRVNGNTRTVVLGFPIETITSPAIRAQLLQRIVSFLLAPMQLTAPAYAPIGTRLQLALNVPGEAGIPYLLTLSDGISPPLPLPGGGLLPLRDSFLLSAPLDPTNPFFSGFLGTLSPSATASPHVDLPPLAFLVGMEFWFCGFTMQPGGPALERVVWNWSRTRIGF